MCQKIHEDSEYVSVKENSYEINNKSNNIDKKQNGRTKEIVIKHIYREKITFNSRPTPILKEQLK